MGWDLAHCGLKFGVRSKGVTKLQAWRGSIIWAMNFGFGLGMGRFDDFLLLCFSDGRAGILAPQDRNGMFYEGGVIVSSFVYLEIGVVTASPI